MLRTSVADPDLGTGAFLTPGSGRGKKSGSGSRTNIPDHISESFETIFWLKILKFFYEDLGFGMEKNLILDPGWKKKSDPVCLSRIPQHCLEHAINFLS
jgi:hypothetical protein